MTKYAFKRQESWRLKRVKPAWRRARGGTSRIRLEASGWPRTPNIGFKGHGSTRGLHPSGLEERRVSQERDLQGLDAKKHIVRLSHQLGEKKRLALVDKIRRLNVKVANPGTLEASEPTQRAGGEEGEAMEGKLSETLDSESNLAPTHKAAEESATESETSVIEEEDKS